MAQSILILDSTETSEITDETILSSEAEDSDLPDYDPPVYPLQRMDSVCDFLHQARDWTLCVISYTRPGTISTTSLPGSGDFRPEIRHLQLCRSNL